MFFIFSMVLFFVLFLFMLFFNGIFLLQIFCYVIYSSKLLKTFLSPELDLTLFVSALISSINFIASLKSFLERNHLDNAVSFDSSSFSQFSISLKNFLFLHLVLTFCLFNQTIQTVCSQIFSF